MSTTKIDPDAFVKAMDQAAMTPARLAEEVGVSITYIVDIRKGRRNLARNPALRQKLARAIDVPTHWIETRPDVAA